MMSNAEERRRGGELLPRVRMKDYKRCLPMSSSDPYRSPPSMLSMRELRCVKRKQVRTRKKTLRGERAESLRSPGRWLSSRFLQITAVTVALHHLYTAQSNSRICLALLRLRIIAIVRTTVTLSSNRLIAGPQSSELSRGARVGTRRACLVEVRPAVELLSESKLYMRTGMSWALGRPETRGRGSCPSRRQL